MTAQSVGARLVHLLERLGVDTVFGIPGSHNLPIFDGIGASSIHLVSPRHEQGAGFAADGYARASGRPGVFVATTGPGILNAATALATAHADSVPVLAISTGARIGDEGRELGWLHESKDQHAALAGLVESIRCRTEEHLYRAVIETFARWGRERTRPVHLDIPIDLAAAPAMVDLPEPVTIPASAPSASALDAALEAITASEHVIVVGGGGAVGARSQINETARLLDAPLVTTRAAAGLLDSGDGDALPTTVLPYAPAELAAADLVLVVGSELSQRDLPPQDRAAIARFVRIDLDAARLAELRPHDVAVLADAATALDLLNERLRESARTTGRRQARQVALADAIATAYPGPLVELHRNLAEFFDDDTVITGDSSQVSYLGTGAHYPFTRPRSFLYPDAFAPLGYGLPAAIGAKLAEPDRPVVALVGDGAFLFSVQELSTAVDERLPILVVVVANDGYREIEEEMVAAAIAPIGVRFRYPDLVAVATAFGATAARVAHVAELAELHRLVTSGEASGPVVAVIDEADL